MVIDPMAKTWLIVRQRPALDVAGQELLQRLASEYGLDVYSTRMRLLGAGMIALDSGEKVAMEERAALLRQGGFEAWVIVPTPPRFPAERLLGLETTSDGLRLRTAKGEFVLGRGMQAVGVLAELTGAVEARLGKRLWVNTVYRGTPDGAPLEEKEVRRTILLGKSVFDLYLIDQGGVTACVRTWPGRFDPKGLGEGAGVSSRANLDLLVQQVEAMAGPFQLHTHFGLSKLPGCKIKREEEGTDWQEVTLRSLLRFGWLMTDLALQPQAARPEPVAGMSVGTVAAGLLVSRPELVVAGGAAAIHPGVREMAQELDAVLTDKDEKGTIATDVAPPELPQPPAPPESGHIPWRVILSTVGGLFGFGILQYHAGRSTLGHLVYSGFASGLLPGVCAMLLFGLGFNRFRLKRMIENTPTSRIRSLAMGVVEVHGRARRKYALVTPMSQSPCVWYRVRRYRRDNRNNWRLVSDNHSGHVPFLLEDATGRVTIDPAGSLVRAGTRSEGSGATTGILFGLRGSSDADEKWVEESIAEGEVLYVLGSAVGLKGERKTLHQRKLQRLRELKTDRGALGAYDTDGDGHISEQEWRTAREAVEDQVVREHLAEKVTPQRAEETIVIGRSSHRSSPFIIAATQSELHLTNSYAWISAVQLTGALGFFIWTLIAVIRYFGVR